MNPDLTQIPDEELEAAYEALCEYQEDLHKREYLFAPVRDHLLGEAGTALRAVHTELNRRSAEAGLGQHWIIEYGEDA